MKKDIKCNLAAYIMIIVIALLTVVALCDCASINTEFISTGSGHYRSKNGTIGGKLQEFPIGHKECSPYRVDINDPRVYYECGGVLCVYSDVSDWTKKR